MNNSTCIPEIELAELLHGNLDAERLEQIVLHVDECSSCQETVQALSEQSDTFADAWQGAAAEDSCESELEYRQAAQELLVATPPVSGQPPHSAAPRVKQLGQRLFKEARVEVFDDTLRAQYERKHGPLPRTRF